MVVETKAFVPVLSYKKSRNELRLSWAKVGKEVIVQARVQLLVH